MLLDGKTAIVYGAAGGIGSAVARAYAREGAVVHLAGRTEATLAELATCIRHDGDTALAQAAQAAGPGVWPLVAGPRSFSRC
jgi:NAD(P)-dependent dehydrogenase (short-subunit alcohol dehydrogenase family)